MDALTETGVSQESREKISANIPNISEKTVNSLFQEYSSSENNISKREKKSFVQRLRYAILPTKMSDEKGQMNDYAQHFITRAKRMQETIMGLPKKYPSLSQHFEHYLASMTFPDITAENAKGSVKESIEQAKLNIRNGFGTVLLAYDAENPNFLKKLEETHIDSIPEMLFEKNLNKERSYPDSLATPDKNLNLLVNNFIGLGDEINGAQAAYEYLQFLTTRANATVNNVTLAA